MGEYPRQVAPKIQRLRCPPKACYTPENNETHGNGPAGDLEWGFEKAFRHDPADAPARFRGQREVVSILLKANTNGPPPQMDSSERSTNVLLPLATLHILSQMPSGILILVIVMDCLS